MGKVFCSIGVLLALLGCEPAATVSNGEQKTEAVITPCAEEKGSTTDPKNVFTQGDAEKIMGEPVHLKDSSTSRNGDATVFQCAYGANAKDAKGKRGVIYFLFEQYGEASSAHDVYAGIKKANENHGIKTLDSLGDEAYFHTDNENFYFVMARKGTKMIRIKVNKITATTSRTEFDLVAKNIVAGF